MSKTPATDYYSADPRVPTAKDEWMLDMAQINLDDYSKVKVDGWDVMANTYCDECATPFTLNESVWNKDETRNYMCQNCYDTAKSLQTPTITDLLSAMAGRLRTQEHARVMKVIHEVAFRGLSNKTTADGREVYNFSIRYTDTKNTEHWTTFQVSMSWHKETKTTKYMV